MYFPVAGIEVSPFVPPLVAFGISFFASMGGISGAFLLLPFQISVLGYVHPSVSGTNHIFNIVAIPGGVYRFIREGRMLWPLAFAIAAGTLPGVVFGTYARIVWLPNPQHFQLFAGFVLLYIGGRLAKTLLKERANATPVASGAQKGGGHPPKKEGMGKVALLRANRREIAYTFSGQEYRCSTPGIFAVSLIIGAIGGAYGIGGGAMIAPVLVAWFGLPVHTLSGATLFGTFLTSFVGVASFTAAAAFFPEQSVRPDWMLGLLFGLGGAVGIYLGARCQKYVPGVYIRWMLAVLLIATAGKYIIGFYV